MIKLYGIPLSNNVNKVRYCLNYLKLPYELVPINPIEGQNKTPEYQNICPTEKIPALSDDDFNIFESDTIVRYLAEKQKSPIYPQDLKKRTIANAWTDFSSIHVANAVSRIMFNRLMAPMLGREVDEKSLQFGLEMLDKYLPMLNQQLIKNKFLAGDELTIADFTLLASLDPCELIKVSLAFYPELSAWRRNLKAQDFYQKCFKDYAEFVQSMMAAKATR